MKIINVNVGGGAVQSSALSLGRLTVCIIVIVFLYYIIILLSYYYIITLLFLSVIHLLILHCAVLCVVPGRLTCSKSFFLFWFFVNYFWGAVPCFVRVRLTWNMFFAWHIASPRKIRSLGALN
jgi:hypothetical protein